MAAIKNKTFFLLVVSIFVFGFIAADVYAATFYRDKDGDSYGDINNYLVRDKQPKGYVTNSLDCRDNDKKINPAAIEKCGDKKDNNCDGKVDENCALNTYYRDADGDTYGSPTSTTTATTAPIGYVSNKLDCNDANAAIHLGAAEICGNSIDEDCSGADLACALPAYTYYQDADADGYGGMQTTQATSLPFGYSAATGDCNDANANINPFATEICNGVDDNCASGADENNVCSTISSCGSYGNACQTDTNGAATCTNGICSLACNTGYALENNVCKLLNIYYGDADGDTYGDAFATTTSTSQPIGYVSNSLDCNDGAANVHPGTAEVCGNGIDEDCSGADLACPTFTFYLDSDADSYGNPAQITQATSQPAGYTSNSLDCNDADATVNPDANEVCNSVDDNCNGANNEGLFCILSTFYLDADADSYGTSQSTTTAFFQPANYVSNEQDCNDADASINICATGTVCSDSTCKSLITYYADADGDNYGDVRTATTGVTVPAGHVTNGLDCSDSNFNINPGATEVCNGIDDNCINSFDEGGVCSIVSSCGTYGNVCSADANSVASCIGGVCSLTCNSGYSLVNGVCTVLNTYYKDSDGDGYGVTADTTSAQYKPVGYAALSGDCDDANTNVKPNNIESCDGLDNNCNLQMDEGGVCNTILHCGTYANACPTDPSGSASCTNGVCSLTCNAGTSLVNGVCTALNTYYKDADADGFGTPTSVTSNYYQPAGYVSNSNDCNDANAGINPGAAETCDDLDNDCDNQIDEGLPVQMYYKDLDGDGYGDIGTAFEACAVASFSVTGAAVAPAGYITVGGDCNDAQASINPSATETCGNGIDEDCSGADLACVTTTGTLSVSSTPTATLYVDGVSKGLTPQTISLEQGSHTVKLTATGYSDYSTTVTITAGFTTTISRILTATTTGTGTLVIDSNPQGASVYLDGAYKGVTPITLTGVIAGSHTLLLTKIDYQDKTQTVSMTAGTKTTMTVVLNALVKYTYYQDADADTYGSKIVTIQATSLPAGYVTNSFDCDDTLSGVNPKGTEVCGNSIDEDCSGADLACPTPACTDSDGGKDYFKQGTCTDNTGKTFTDYCMAAAGTVVEFACSSGACLYESYGEATGSCTNGAWQKCVPTTEICGDGKDQDCDGADTACSVVNTYYRDADADTYGSTAETTTSTSTTPPSGYVSNNNDCNDANAAIHLGAAEICGNSIDEDCSGSDLACTTGTPNIYAYIDAPTQNQQITSGSTATFGGWAGDVNGVYSTSTQVYINNAPITLTKIARADACKDWPKIYECTAAGGNTQLLGWYFSWTAPSTTGTYIIKAVATSGSYTSTASKTFSVVATVSTTVSTTCTDTDVANSIYVKGTCTDSSGMRTDFCYTGGKEIVDHYCYDNKCVPNGGWPTPSGGICRDGAFVAAVSTPCTDTDNGIDGFTTGTCTDQTGTYTDYCTTGTPATYAYDYICSSGLCVKSVVTSSVASCSGGSLTPKTQQSCTDTDGGIVLSTFGTCTDAWGNKYYDHCYEYGLTEYSCTEGGSYCFDGGYPFTYVPEAATACANNPCVPTTEICGDKLDQDCNGFDLACPTTKTYYRDFDSDAFGNILDATTDQSVTYGRGSYVLNSDDCNDANANINPPATDVCGDGIDQDCSGVDTGCVTITCTPTNGGVEICGNGIDEDCSGSDLACTTTTTGTPNIYSYIDAPTQNQQLAAGSTTAFGGWAGDVNGVYSTSTQVYINNAPITLTKIARADACKDWPKMVECTAAGGNTQLVGWWFYWTAPSTASTYTIKAVATAGSTTSTTSKSFSVVGGTTTATYAYYKDSDADGYGGSIALNSTSTTPPSGYVSNSNDCNDNNADIHLGATEICGNGIDEDCSGADLACPIINITATTCTPTNSGVEICGNNIDEDCSGADLACQSCTDTDGGLDYYTAGTCTNRYGTQYADKCLTTTSGVQLYEYYCSTDAVDCSATLHSESGYDCANGKLVPQTTTTACTDTDGGKLYTTKGTCTDSTGSYTDSCPYSAWVKEYYCTSAGCASVDNTAIDYSCSDGALYATSTSAPDLTATCTDSDGINYKTKGTCTYGSATYTDYCSGSLVMDYYCISSGCSTNSYKTTASLGESCVDGTLVKCTPTNSGVEICGNGIDEDCSGSDLACPVTCTPSWACTGWSICADGQETRICTDSNNCGTTDGKPGETQSCTPAIVNTTTGAAVINTPNGLARFLFGLFGMKLW